MDDSDSDSARSDYLEQRAPLKKELLQLIKPHRIPNVKPPFNPTEMAIIAIICSSNYDPDHMDILGFIIKTFRYYALKALDVYIEAGRDDADRDLEKLKRHEECVVDRFFEAFQEWEVPLIPTNYEYGYGDTPCNFTVDLRAARIYLAKHLGPVRLGTFRFLDMAPELRNTVYELVLSVSGRQIVVWGSSCGAREYDSKIALGMDPDLPSMNQFLSLLSVCKQINKEASPIFYDINAFKMVDGLDRFNKRTLKMAPERFGNIADLTISIFPVPNFHVCAQSLLDRKPFRKLTFGFDDTAWLNMKGETRKTCFSRVSKFKSLQQIPGLKSLVRVAYSASRFKIEGQCPQIRAFFKEEWAKLKADGVERLQPEGTVVKTSSSK